MWSWETYSCCSGANISLLLLACSAGKRGTEEGMNISLAHFGSSKCIFVSVVMEFFVSFCLLLGHFQTKDVRGQTAADGPFLSEGERSSEGVRAQTPATPPPSRFHSTPPHKTTPPPDSGNSIPTPVSFHPSCSCSPRRTDESLKEEVLQPTPVKPDSELSLGPAGLMCCMSPSSLSQGSFSLSSRPLSSLFSRSTDLCSSRNSRNTSGKLSPSH